MKRKFRFRLEAVEKVRRSKEQECMRLLAQAQSRYYQALNFKADLLTALEKSLLRREKLSEAPQSILAFQIENDFIVGTKQRVIQADQFILKAKKHVEKALRAYLDARRATRAIEVLREKAYEEFKLEQRKREQKELEDLYVMRARVTKESA